MKIDTTRHTQEYAYPGYGLNVTYRPLWPGVKFLGFEWRWAKKGYRLWIAFRRPQG